MLCQGHFGQSFVAVKVIQPDVSGGSQYNDASIAAVDQSTVAAVIDEIDVLARLDHCNVVRLVGVCCSAGPPYYIVTDECGDLGGSCQGGGGGGGTLRDWLKRSSSSGGDELAGTTDRRRLLIDICLQATAAVAYLHGFRYVVHRAIKTHSFVVCRQQVSRTLYSLAVCV